MVKLVGTTFSDKLDYLLCNIGDEVVIWNKPETHGGKHYPNQVIVERDGKIIGCLAEHSPEQQFVCEQNKQGKHVIGRITNFTYHDTIPALATAVKNFISKNGEVSPSERAELSKLIQAKNSTTDQLAEHTDRPELNIYTIKTSVTVEIDGFKQEPEPEHLDWETSPKGVKCESITHFLESNEHLILSPQEIAKNESYRTGLGERAHKLLMASTALEGNSLHATIHTTLYLWSLLSPEQRQEQRQKLAMFQTPTNLSKLLLNYDFDNVTTENTHQEEHTLFIDDLALKGTADVIFNEREKPYVLDNKRSTVLSSSGEKNHLKHFLQISFYCKAQELKTGIKHRGIILYWQLSGEGNHYAWGNKKPIKVQGDAPLVIKEFSEEEIDKYYDMLVKVKQGQKVYE